MGTKIEPGVIINGALCIGETDKRDSHGRITYIWQCTEEGCDNTFERDREHIKRGHTKCKKHSNNSRNYIGETINGCECLSCNDLKGNDKKYL